MSARANSDVYRRAGATVTVMAADPDGLNINDGVGSTHIDGLAKAVAAAAAQALVRAQRAKKQVPRCR